jgi:site-specific DNA recombinase
MGHLTLNVLLSFAQFEREVTGERIRDKIAASKKKGVWMGSPVPLGYDLANRQFVINTQEAETVRRIFAGYLFCKALPIFKIDSSAPGFCANVERLKKVRISVVGRSTRGSTRFTLLLGKALMNGCNQ